MENITELGKLWQEEIINLSETTPESLDALENRIQDVLHRLGKAMMKWIGKAMMAWKLHEWNSSLKKDKCSECDSKVHNRKRTKQILTTVATIDYKRSVIRKGILHKHLNFLSCFQKSQNINVI